ncbi:MAG: PrsW family intramembrane metalloprotease, partial [Candidatus Heimdallarchaeota archaeon]
SLISVDFIIVGPIISAVIIAPVIEEFTKGFFVVQLSKDESFDGPLDGLIYGAMVGSGFATIENLLYGFSAILINIDAGVQLTIYRSLPQIVGHPLYTGIMGAGVGAYKVGLNRSKYNLVWQSIVLHGMWNGAASIADPTLFYVGLAIVVGISIIRLRGELIKAIELDKQAYERGYYVQKKVYLEYMKSQYDLWYYQNRYNQYPMQYPNQQHQQNLSGHSPPNHQNGQYSSQKEDIDNRGSNFRKPNDNVD